MTLWSDLFHTRHLISRTFYGVPGTTTLTAPAGATVLRASGVGAGGWRTGNWGHGAAFARKKLLGVSPGETFTLQVGDIAHSLDAGDALGDTIITRVTGAVVILKAQRGLSTGPGLAANSIGDVKRDGLAWAGGQIGGYSAGDDADDHPLGFGGPGSASRPDRLNTGAQSAAPGGGGGKNVQPFPGLSNVWTQMPGNGRVAIEWFDQDPGY